MAASSTVTEGIGTSAQGVTATYGYTNNGKPAYVVDGNNNRTSYVYDGFDRMVQTQYPSSSKGTNSSNTGDYEAVLAYDANGNPTQTRLRDGNTIGLTYDNLGRLTSRTVQTNVSIIPIIRSA
jgi:YD repeat-containing protein